ncbi:hypothetical protein GCM10017600_36650 [Streptosporangium carneum]|uniref:Uncharacterized protein n=1 Tax=Streptosporangium carneum TaxID=47481 RepID=A0A9W6I2V5_9ACTN|nr:hypothetical protein GCM10017600_36650 [Streptosporangium carneum]
MAEERAERPHRRRRTRRRRAPPIETRVPAIPTAGARSGPGVSPVVSSADGTAPSAPFLDSPCPASSGFLACFSAAAPASRPPPTRPSSSIMARSNAMWASGSDPGPASFLRVSAAGPRRTGSRTVWPAEPAAWQDRRNRREARHIFGRVHHSPL